MDRAGNDFWAEQVRLVEAVAVRPQAVPDEVAQIRSLLQLARDADVESGALLDKVTVRLSEVERGFAEARGSEELWREFREKVTALSPTTAELQDAAHEGALRFGRAMDEFRKALHAARRAWRVPRCRLCGHDRSGLAPDAKCPECGMTPPSLP